MKPDDKIAEFFRDYRRNYLEITRNQRWAVTRRVGQARAFLKGDPADWFDGVNWRWRAASEFAEYDPDTAPRFNHHINIFQAGWLILNAAIQTTGIPGAIFSPQDSHEDLDREAARVANPICEYERSVIKFPALWSKVFQKMFTDGICVGYARHVVDGPRLGYRIEKQKETKVGTIREAGYDCFQCNSFTPQGMTPRNETGMIECPICKTPMHAENFAGPRTGVVEETTKSVKVPKGKEMVEIFGALECPLPWWSADLETCPVIPIVTDVQKEVLVQTFTDFEDQIMGHYDTEGDEPNLQRARLTAKIPQGSIWEPGINRTSAYGRWWFRPETYFSQYGKNVREELLEEYPEGAFVQFAGDICLDVIPENPDNHLVLFRALPGDGMYTPSLGQNGVPIQLSTNTAWNLSLEGMEFAAFAPILIDSVLLSLEAMKQTRARPAEYKSVVVPPNKTLEGAYKQIIVKDISPACMKFLDAAKAWMEFLVGTSPALAGTQMTNVRSFAQANQQKNQALQRLATPYENAKEGFAKIDEILVHEFLQNRNQEEFKAVVAGESSDQRQATILLDQAQGRVFARSEESESIPQTWGQQQSAIDQMIEQSGQSPMIQAWLSDPNNAEVLFRTRGLKGFTVPGKDQLDKVLNRTIPALLADKPKQPDLSQAPTLDPATGAPKPPEPQPSIQFDQVLDDPAVVVKVIRKWAASPEGNDAQQTNADGFENVRIYCQQALLAVAQATQGTQSPAAQPASQPAGARA